MKAILALILWLSVAGMAYAANPQMPVIPTTVFNVTNYGAVGDGVTDNTTSIQNTINAANAAGGGVVEIPVGTFECGPIILLSEINLRLDTNAVLQMLPLGIYPGGATNAQTFITCNSIHDLEISGQGTFDGQGAAWWAYFATNTTIVRPMILNLYSVDRLFIHDVTYTSPPNHHCGLRSYGGNITISNLTVNTYSNSPNTDGLNFVATNSIIENCHISDGDDNIAMGSTGPLNDLLITNCAFGRGHGLSIGSGISGITNLTAINCSFNGTGNGLRIKCARDNSLPINGLNYLNITMTNVGIPIVFYSYYDIIGGPTSIPATEVLAASNTYPVNATTPNWSNITISNLTATGTSIGGIIWGPTEWPVSNVTFIHVTITAPKTFDLYNVRGVKVIDSQFNFSSGNTFTLCNADLTISNSTTGGQAVTIGGAASTNSLALYNARATMASTDAFAASPITLGGGVLTNSGSLTFSNNEVFNFALGTNSSTIVVNGNLNLSGTLNIRSAGGFTTTNYVVFTYTGALVGVPTIGSVPAGYSCALYTGTPGQVKVVVTYTGTSPTATTNTLQSSANPSAYGTVVKFTATVSPAPTNGEAVAFSDGVTTLGTGTLTNGEAAFTATANQLAVGSHTIIAAYGGDGAYGASSSTGLTQTVNPLAGQILVDTFSASTVDSANPASPTAISTSYQVLAGKPWSPNPTILPDGLEFGIGATSSGVIELQALFAAKPISLLAAGDFVQMKVVFTDTAGILTQTGNWDFGLYNSGGSMPVTGGLNGNLSSGSTTAATGGTQNWQGYIAQIGFTGATSGFYDRKSQPGGTANNDQGLLTIGTSSSYQTPAAAAVGTPSTAPSITLTVGSQYAEILTYTLTPSNVLSLQNQLYMGTDATGTLLSTMSTVTGTTPLANSYDGLAIGWRATGSAASTMTVNAITVTGQSTPPVIQSAGSRGAVTLSWPGNYLGWQVQSNTAGLGATNWVTIPGSGGATNFPIPANATATNVFYRLVAP